VESTVLEGTTLYLKKHLTNSKALCN
jgi:stage II sporulation protein AB (anti-sigma F factor)